MEASSGTSEDSSDIEIVSIQRSQQPPSKLIFAWNELRDSDGVISFMSLKAALGKYEVHATDDQIFDMMMIAHGKSSRDLLQVYKMCGIKCEE